MLLIRDVDNFVILFDMDLTITRGTHSVAIGSKNKIKKRRTIAT